MSGFDNSLTGKLPAGWSSRASLYFVDLGWYIPDRHFCAGNSLSGSVMGSRASFCFYQNQVLSGVCVAYAAAWKGDLGIDQDGAVPCARAMHTSCLRHIPRVKPSERYRSSSCRCHRLRRLGHVVCMQPGRLLYACASAFTLVWGANKGKAWPASRNVAEVRAEWSGGGGG